MQDRKRQRNMKYEGRLGSQLRGQVLPLLRKGFWAVTDQGLFAGANFLLNIFLARWLSPAEYGAFTVIYMTFLLAGRVHTALLTEPMLVFGPGRFEDRFPTYLRALLWGHGGFAIVGSILAAGVALWFAYAGAASLAAALFGLALALPFLLFLWLVRMAPYVLHKPQQATLAGAVYLSVLLAAVFLINRYAQFSVQAAFLGMAGASLVAGVCITARLDVHLFSSAVGKPLLKDIIDEHWKYGRWAVATSVLAWVPGQAYYLLLPLWVGLKEIGALKAVINLIMPIAHANGAFSTLLVPELVKARSEGRFWDLIKITLALFLSATTIYWLFIGFFGAELTNWLYDGRYVEYADLLWLLGGIPVLLCISTVLSAALRAIESPQWITRAYVFSSAITLTVGVVCIALWGLWGAAAAMLLSTGATAAGLVLSRHALHKTETFEKTTNVERAEQPAGSEAPAQAEASSHAVQ